LWSDPDPHQSLQCFLLWPDNFDKYLYPNPIIPSTKAQLHTVHLTGTSLVPGDGLVFFQTPSEVVMSSKKLIKMNPEKYSVAIDRIWSGPNDSDPD
jgi:hypothetical protein